MEEKIENRRTKINQKNYEKFYSINFQIIEIIDLLNFDKYCTKNKIFIFLFKIKQL